MSSSVGKAISCRSSEPWCLTTTVNQNAARAARGGDLEYEVMASLIEASEIKRKMFFEFEGAPYHCIDVEVSKPTARGGQTLVRLKMRNLLTRARSSTRHSRRERSSRSRISPTSA